MTLSIESPSATRRAYRTPHTSVNRATLRPRMPHVSSRYLKLVDRQSGGAGASLALAGLGLLSAPYRMIVAARNAWYDWVPGAVHRPERPVISIGNITVGGTGKTPMTAKLAHLLIARGLKVAILTRGYKGAIAFDDERREDAVAELSAASDEAQVLRRRCPQARVYVSPNRAQSAEAAVAEGADCLLLDDGFQHRRLARDFDIVLIDATRPFGHKRLLPGGLLREPLSNLSRAGLVILTRSDEVPEATRTDISRTIQRASDARPLIYAVQRINGFLDIKGRTVAHADPAAMQAIIFAGIGNFESFRRCVERLGIKTLAAYEFPDHHHYTTDEISGLADTASAMDANALLTTEKDAVKLVGRWSYERCPLWALNLEVEFLGEGDRILAEMVDQALRRKAGG